MISRLENADAGSSDWCLWAVWQNARLRSAPRVLPECWEVGSQTPSRSHSPSDGAGGCSFVSPACLRVVSLVTEQEPHPAVTMQGENDMLFTEQQSSPGWRQWYRGHLRVAARRGCPGAARADPSWQPVPGGDMSEDSTSTCCGFCYSPPELTVATVVPMGQRHGWKGTSHPPGGAQHSLDSAEIRAWSPGPIPAPPPPAQPLQGLRANGVIHCSATLVCLPAMAGCRAVTNVTRLPCPHLGRCLQNDLLVQQLHHHFHVALLGGQVQGV